MATRAQGAQGSHQSHVSSFELAEMVRAREKAVTGSIFFKEIVLPAPATFKGESSSKHDLKTVK
jgi:hypothetical protein